MHCLENIYFFFFQERPCDGFKCKNGKCINNNKVCDGLSQCPDKSDEDTNMCKVGS